jgi:hypothetical protein
MTVAKLRVRDNQSVAHGLDVEAQLFARTADSDDAGRGSPPSSKSGHHGSPTLESRVLSKRTLPQRCPNHGVSEP